jgi:hypothetical protein
MYDQAAQYDNNVQYICRKEEAQKQNGTSHLFDSILLFCLMLGLSFLQRNLLRM